MKQITRWIDARFPISRVWKEHLVEYYAPKNFNFYYYFGSLALFIFLSQIVTGIWLTMFYTPTAQDAFNSVEYIMRDVNYGWLIRYMHSTGASAFFIVMYLHMFKAVLYGSYQKPRELVWLIGTVLFILLMAEAFMGYLLPWGQMSFWGAQVITSLFGAIPVIGDWLLTFIRGDYTISNATLQRFFSLHVIAIPLLMVGLVFFHLVALHQVGSNNPEGIDIKKIVDEKGKPLDSIPFHPYYTLKDLVGLVVFLIGFFAVVFFAPEMGGYFLEPDNFSPANAMITPEHIAPVWYMTPFYSILRAIPNKLAGVTAMGIAILILLILPWLDKSPVKSMRYKGRLSRIALGLFVGSFIILGVLGTMTVTPLRQIAAQICTLLYFGYFLFMPIYTRLESYRNPPERIEK